MSKMNRPVILALFAGLSILTLMMTFSPVFAATTTYASRTTTYSCSVTVSYSSGAFTVKTVVTASGGYLPGPSITDYLQSYHSGTLYNTQSVKFSVGSNQASITMNVPVSSAGTGTYTFSSKILDSKGNQLTSCSGTYTL